MIAALQPKLSSYLGDVQRLYRTPEVVERLMILVLQKSATVDRFGRAMLAVQVSEREHNLEFEQFFLRVSEI
jgi:hypothetical protein